MKIDKCVEIPDGTLQFKGELDQQELDTVVQYGLNTLFALGIIKATVVSEEDLPSQDDTLQ